jgi:hypothetical protein
MVGKYKNGGDVCLEKNFKLKAARKSKLEDN